MPGTTPRTPLSEQL
eukprot:Gb_10596 [translate_table: standard]